MCMRRTLSMPVLVMTIAYAMLVSGPAARAQVSLASEATTHEAAPSSPQIWVLPAQGPPGTLVLVQGTGFDPLTEIGIDFDSTQVASTSTDKNGAFGNGVVTATGATFTDLQVLGNAVPGQHTITAWEPRGQKSAEKSFLVQTDWPQFGFDVGHTGFNRYENVVNDTNVQNLVLDWTFATGAPVYGDPAVVGGVVYFTSNNYPDAGLFALNATTGALLWKNTNGTGTRTPPTVVNGVVYIGQEQPNGGVYAFNAATGEPLWQYTSMNGAGGAVIVDGSRVQNCL